MPTDDAPTTFGRLIGTDGPEIRWSLALSLYIALVGSGLLSGAIVSAVRGGSSLIGMPVYGWMYTFGFPLLLTASIVVVFRLFRRDFLSSLIAPLVYVVLAIPADLLLRPSGGNDQTSASLHAWFGWIRFFANALFLLGIVVAMRWIRRWWLALPLGAAAGEVLMLAIAPLGVLLTAPAYFTVQSNFLARLYALPSALVEVATLAGLLWIGREVSTAMPGRVSKRFYLASTAGGLWLGTLLAVILISMSRDSYRPRPAILLAVGTAAAVIILYAGVVMMVLVYKMWKAIQDGHARTTPGKAIGLMFVPLFSLYWVFQVFWGFAKDYNQFIDRHKVQAQRLAPGLFLAYVIFSLAAGIPLLGLLFAAIDLFLGASLVAKICDAINSIPLPEHSRLPMTA